MPADTKMMFTAEDGGCYVDGARGIYMGERVIALARTHGWEPDMSDWDEEDFTVDGECHDDAIDAATEFLQTLAPEGYWFGFDEHGNGFGLWPSEEYGVCIGEWEDGTPIWWGEGDGKDRRTFECWTIACGWLDVLYVHSSHTEALELADDLLEQIEQYCALDEDDWSRREEEKADEYWQASSIRERIGWCQRYRVSIFAARRDEVPSDPSGELVSALAE